MAAKGCPNKDKTVPQGHNIHVYSNNTRNNSIK